MQNFLFPYKSELIVSLSDEAAESYPHLQTSPWQKYNHSSALEMTISLGPTNLSLPFPLHLRMQLKEKKICLTQIEIGWLHQGIEKAFEKIPWPLGPSFATRINPFAPAPVALSFTLAVEKLLKIDETIPLIAQNYRVLMLESAHIYHHLSVLHNTISILSSPTIVKSSMLAVDLTRKLQSAINYDEEKNPRWNIGGLNFPLHTNSLKQLKSQITDAQKLVDHLCKTVFKEATIEKRLSRLGVLSKTNILSFGITGPCLRACGIADDLRHSQSYFNYSSYKPSIHIQENGDAWSRFLIRANEINSSFDLLNKISSDILSEIENKQPKSNLKLIAHMDLEKLPIGTQTSCIESPEGELTCTLVSDGSNCPYRVRLHTPSFALAAAISDFLQNANIDDVVLILCSLGITSLEVDR